MINRTMLNFNIMKTLKDSYESPFSKVIRIEIQGIICESQLPTSEDDPEEIGWDGE